MDEGSGHQHARGMVDLVRRAQMITSVLKVRCANVVGPIVRATDNANSMVFSVYANLMLPTQSIAEPVGAPTWSAAYRIRVSSDFGRGYCCIVNPEPIVGTVY